MSSSTIPRVPGKGEMLERVARFIKDVGFPIAVATALVAYLWFIGVETNKHLARGAEIMDKSSEALKQATEATRKSIDVLERLERRVGQ